MFVIGHNNQQTELVLREPAQHDSLGCCKLSSAHILLLCMCLKKLLWCFIKRIFSQMLVGFKFLYCTQVFFSSFGKSELVREFLYRYG